MMSKSHVQIVSDVSKALATLQGDPETMQGFGAMAKSSLQDGVLSELQRNSSHSRSPSPSAATPASASTSRR